VSFLERREKETPDWPGSSAEGQLAAKSKGIIQGLARAPRPLFQRLPGAAHCCTCRHWPRPVVGCGGAWKPQRRRGDPLAPPPCRNCSRRPRCQKRTRHLFSSALLPQTPFLSTETFSSPPPNTSLLLLGAQPTSGCLACQDELRLLLRRPGRFPHRVRCMLPNR